MDVHTTKFSIIIILFMMAKSKIQQTIQQLINLRRMRHRITVCSTMHGDGHGFQCFNLQAGTMSYGCLNLYSSSSAMMLCMCLGNYTEDSASGSLLLVQFIATVYYIHIHRYSDFLLGVILSHS